jgi:exopolysaccharide biosynthesis polyprenyl glycosylphosphotransferase
VHIGVLWGYPFSLVRRLFLVFLLLLGLCGVMLYIRAQPASALDMLLHIVPIASAILIAMYVAEMIGVTERPRPPLSIETLFWAIATSCLVMCVGYAILPTWQPSRIPACLTPIVATGMIYLQRKWQEARGNDEEQDIAAVMFAGTRDSAMRGVAALAETPGVHVRTVLVPSGVDDRTPLAGIPVMDVAQAVWTLTDRSVRLFLVADGGTSALAPVLPSCAAAGCIIENVDDLVAKSQGRVNLTRSDDVALLNRITTGANIFNAQRVYDLIFVHVLAIVAFVPALLTALAVRLTSRGPILYRQRRVGRWGREFTMYKFRTMRVDAERETGPIWAQADDPRVTPVGRFLRRTRLDELPQLYNVLRGDMSLVGPRPERAHFVDDLRHKIPLYDARHAIRPGLTGWAQIRYAYGADAEDAKMKLGYELFFLLHRSTIFYFAILLETVKVLLFRRGAR